MYTWLAIPLVSTHSVLCSSVHIIFANISVKELRAAQFVPLEPLCVAGNTFQVTFRVMWDAHFSERFDNGYNFQLYFHLTRGFTPNMYAFLRPLILLTISIIEFCSISYCLRCNVTNAQLTLKPFYHGQS